MQININDILFWMDAIRNSKDRSRTLESFWKGQIKSKIWLIERLQEYCTEEPYYHQIVIHGGWNGVLSSLLFNSDILIKNITSVDIDSSCEEIAYTMNKQQEIQGKFTAITEDMCMHRYSADIVINTSCEHISDIQLEAWYKNIPANAIIVMQSNNYFDLEEHINCVNSSKELAEKVDFVWHNTYELELSKYTRYMVIGQKQKKL